MKKLPKNLVAFVFFSILLFGFFYCNTPERAVAATVQGTTATIAAPTYTDSTGNYIYTGGGQWLNTNSTTTRTTAQVFQNGVPQGITDGMVTFDQNLSEAGGSWWGDTAGKIADYAAGVVNAPGFLLTQLILFTIGLILVGILTIVGLIFDKAIIYSIYHLGDILMNLNSVWVLFRDIVNVFFIFILLYIAIKKILSSSGLDEKKALGNLVINAIFVNFSMFIAKFLIDVGNIITIAIYNQVNGGGGITNMILDNMHLVDLFKLDLAASYTGQTDILVLLILKLVVVGITTYVFVWGAVIFLGRAVMLIFLVVTSPIAYFGNAIPKLKSIGDDWWQEFTNQILVAPIFMLFMLIIAKVLSLNQAVVKASTLNSPVNISGYFLFILIILLLLRALKETKKLSGEIANTMMKVAKGGLAVAAIAATGGAAAASGLGGALLETGAAKGIAGKIGLEGQRSRLALTGKNFASGVGKFASGGFEKEPGLFAKGLTSVRGNLNSGFKTATAGNVDIIGVQKALEKSAKDQIEKNQKALEPATKKKAEQEQIKSDLEKQDKIIDAKAKQKIKEEREENTQENYARKETEGEHAENQQNLKKAQEAEAAAMKTGNTSKIADAAANTNKAQATVDASEKRVADFKKAEERRLATLKEELAQQAGTTLNEMAIGVAKATVEIENASAEIEDRIRKVASTTGVAGALNYGTFGLTSKAAKKSRENTERAMREFAKKGGKNSPAEEMQKLFENFTKNQTTPKAPPTP